MADTMHNLWASDYLTMPSDFSSDSSLDDLFSGLEHNARNAPQPAKLPPENLSSVNWLAESTGQLNETKDQNAQTRKRRVSPPEAPLQSASSAARSSLRFVVVDHPDQLRDKQEMRENRTHVMLNFLDKERQRPASKDPRVNGSAKLQGRKDRPYTPKPTTVNFARTDSFQTTSCKSISQSSLPTSNDVSRLVKTKAPASDSDETSTPGPAPLVRRLDISHNDEQPLISGLGGRYENSRYMRTKANEIPPHVGGQVEPFGTWPALSDPSLNLNALKWSCSQRFGTTTISTDWIPTMLRARHAFLSSCCISSAYDSIMNRALRPSHVQTSELLVQRWKVKRDVILMVSEAVNDPEMQLADETFIAVIHLLSSDIMGCDDSDMRVHQDGLHKMVLQKGGLEKLGLRGLLATIITTTMYLVAALREMQPLEEFVRYANRQDTRVPTHTRAMPESPIFCRAIGFLTIHKAVSPESEIHSLLDAVRVLTNHFLKVECRPDETITSLRGKIFAFPPCTDMDFNDMNERYTYESIRLTARVFAHALVRRLPFSKAAKELCGKGRSTSSASRVHKLGGLDEDTPVPIQIQYALMRTDTSFCWGQMAGVLFWVSLVASATANPGPFTDEWRVGVDEDARKWAAAIAVRTCVVLSFEYGNLVLGTVKRMVDIETALANPDAEVFDSVAHAGPASTMQQTSSSAETPGLQRGFSDFAHDFLGD